MPEHTLPVEHLFTMEVQGRVDQAHHVRNGPMGRRIVVGAGGGTVTGPKVTGTIAAGFGGDWVMSRPDRTSRLDVRIVILTDDEATILMYYSGIAKDGRVLTAPYFETGDERYVWLNNVQAVSYARLVPGKPTSYEVFALRHPDEIASTPRIDAA